MIYTLPHRMETVVTESFVYLTWEVLGIWKGLIWVAGDCVALEEARVFKEVGSTPGHVTKRLAHLDEENDSSCSHHFRPVSRNLTSDRKCQAGDFPTFPSSPSLTMSEGSSFEVI